MDSYYKNKFENTILVAKKMTLDDQLRKSIEMIDDPQTYFITDNNYVIGNLSFKQEMLSKCLNRIMITK